MEELDGWINLKISQITRVVVVRSISKYTKYSIEIPNLNNMLFDVFKSQALKSNRF